MIKMFRRDIGDLSINSEIFYGEKNKLFECLFAIYQ